MLALTACGISGPDAGGHTGGGAAGEVAPELSTVQALDDPRAHRGASTAVVGSDEIDPVATDPKPKLPVTVTDAQGTEVTVTSTDRILALDVYATLSRTVFELCLGDSVIGKDTSTTFEGTEDLPKVTQNGHDLDAEAILDLDPTVILTDTSLGPGT